MVDQILKYRKYEFERIFLMKRNCLLDLDSIDTKEIRDKYIKGTSLRLREVKTNTKTTYKLTQKHKLNPQKIGVLKTNTIYLSKSEFDIMNVLMGFIILKKRYIVLNDQIRFGIDMIKLNNSYLYIAEVEFDSEMEMNSFSMPLEYITEITGKLEYSGYELARKYSDNKHVH